ncbi:MAG TPA: hypothetical protein VFM18_22660 [Methanosarcina sp.]|nr:hypothetical protein [Methanosarcina sp.]
MKHNVELSTDELKFLTDLVGNHLNGSHPNLMGTFDKLDSECRNNTIEYNEFANVNFHKTKENLDHVIDCLWVGEQ